MNNENKKSMTTNIKVAWLSYTASPHNITMSNEFRKHLDCTFLFYAGVEHRGSWWKTPIGEENILLKNVFFKKSRYFFTFSHLKVLKKLNPDIVVLGGFLVPANYIAYVWAKWNKKPVIVFTEKLRNKRQVPRTSKSIISTLIRFLYKKIDLVLVVSENAVAPMKEALGFGDRIKPSAYGALIDDYFKHEIRKPKEGYTYIFANRLIDNYNPLLAIDVFNEIVQKYPKSILKLNALGALREKCEKKVREFNLETHVEFLDNLTHFSDLDRVYSQSDILLFPAIASIGNYTVYEAMASGMGIVISNKIQSAALIIENNKNGFYIEPTKEAFVESIMKYINTSDLFKIHALINREIVKKHSISNRTKEIVELMKELYQQKSKGS